MVEERMERIPRHPAAAATTRQPDTPRHDVTGGAPHGSYRWRRRAWRTLRHADAALAVAAERAKRGQHEIAHARQPRDRLAQPKM